MAKIVITGPAHEAGLALIEARPDIEVDVVDNATVADLEARIADMDALVLRLTPVGADLIAKAGRLKVVSRYGVG